MAARAKDLLQPRAISHLRARLRAYRTSAARGHVTSGDPELEGGVDGTLRALVHVGAITRGEAEGWRVRLLGAVEEPVPPPPPVAPEVRACAIAHLERISAPLSPARRADATRCFSAVAAYLRVGVLDPEEALAWREQLRARLSLPPERPRLCRRRDLIRIVPASPERQKGLRVTTAELYRDGVVVRWHHASRSDDMRDVPRLWSTRDVEVAAERSTGPERLEDDLGTRYVGAGDATFGINGGGWLVRFGESSFTPAPPERAHRLVALIGERAVEIDLRRGV